MNPDKILIRDVSEHAFNTELEVPRAPEKPADMVKPESILEGNNKIIIDFDVETKEKEAEKIKTEEQIARLEKEKQMPNVPALYLRGIEGDINKLQEQKAGLAADLGKRGPNETEQMIGGEIDKINKKVENIRTAENQDQPGTVPSAILEGRKKDVEDLDRQKLKMLEELGIAKAEKVKKYYEGAEEVTLQQEAPEVQEFREVTSEQLQRRESFYKEQEKQKKEEEAKKREAAWKMLGGEEVISMRPGQLIETFRDATDRDLAQEADEMVRKNFEITGEKVMGAGEAGKAYREQLITEEKQKINQEQHSKALETLWQRNPNIKPVDRDKYLDGIRKNLGLELKDIGDNVALDKLINDGYVIEKAKTGWFGWGKVKIPIGDGTVMLVCNRKKNLLEQIERQSRNAILDEAQKRADAAMIADERHALIERSLSMQAIIKIALEGHDLEEQRKLAAEEEERAEVEKQKEQTETEEKAKVEKTENNKPEKKKDKRRIRRNRRKNKEKITNLESKTRKTSGRRKAA